MLSMIDTAVTHAQFAAFPQELALRLLTAAEADIVEWCDRLLAAWDQGNADDIARARHSLKGLCGNLGAVKLLALTEADLDSAAARQAFIELRKSTLYAIRMVALGAPGHSGGTLP